MAPVGTASRSSKSQRMNEPEGEKRETVRSSYSFSNVVEEIGWTEAQVLKWSLTNAERPSRNSSHAGLGYSRFEEVQ